MPKVKADDLVGIMQWVSEAIAGDNQAYVCRETGRIYLVPGDYRLLRSLDALGKSRHLER